ncbi:hypothetical protein NMG60_11014994 [Bertholletia excelsa]
MKGSCERNGEANRVARRGHKYKFGDSVPLYANKFGPFHNPRSWILAKYILSHPICRILQRRNKSTEKVRKAYWGAGRVPASSKPLLHTHPRRLTPSLNRVSGVHGGAPLATPDRPSRHPANCALWWADSVHLPLPYALLCFLLCIGTTPCRMASACGGELHKSVMFGNVPIGLTWAA